VLLDPFAVMRASSPVPPCSSSAKKRRSPCTACGKPSGHLVGRSAQKGGLYVGKTKRGKGTKIMAMVDRSGLPLAIDLESASPHESTLLENLLRQSFLRRVPCRKLPRLPSPRLRDFPAQAFMKCSLVTPMG
jgi:hypothetical protein